MYLNGHIYDYLDSEAYKLLNDYGMFKFPLDVYTLAEKLNAKVFIITQEKIEQLKAQGLIDKVRDGCVITKGINHYIYLNIDNTEERSRFTVAHEIAHIVLEDESNDLITESAADHFASVLLVPPVVLMHKGRISYKTICRQFGVSSTVAQRVWKNARNREETYADGIFDYEKEYYNGYIRENSN